MAQVAVVMTSKDAQLWQGMQKLIAQQTKMEKGFGKVGRSARRAGTESKREFGPAGASRLAKYAVGVMGIHKAISVTTRALTEMQQVRREGGRRLAESEMGMAELAQLATTPKELATLRGAARWSYGEGGAANLDQAARTVFSLKSAGAMKHLDLFTQLRSTGLVGQPDVMARSARTLIASMGKEETGSFRDLVSKAFAASEFSPARAEELLEAAARSGGGARALGLRDEEILAATALRATATGEPARGGTQVRRLLMGLLESGEFQGMNLRDILTDVQGRRLSREDLKGRKLSKEQEKALVGQPLDIEGLKKIIGGRLEGIEAYRGLVLNLEEYDKALAAIDKAQAEDRVGVQLKLPGTIPELRAARHARKARAGRELGETDLGTQSLYADAIQEQVQASMVDAGYPESFRWLVSTMMRGHRLVGGDKDLINVFDQQQGTSELSQDVRGFRAAKALEQAAAKLEKAVDRMQGTATLAHPDDDPGGRKR